MDLYLPGVHPGSMTQVASGSRTEGGRTVLFIPAALAAAIAIAMLERTAPQFPIGILALLALSVLLVIGSLQRPRPRPS